MSQQTSSLSLPFKQGFNSTQRSIRTRDSA